MSLTRRALHGDVPKEIGPPARSSIVASHKNTDPLKSYGYQTRATHRAFDRTLQRHIGKHALSNGFW